MSYAAIIARAEARMASVTDESERATCRYIIHELERFDAGTRDEDPSLIVARLEQILRHVAPA